MLIPQPEPLSIVTYLSQFYHAFNGKGPARGGLSGVTVTPSGNVSMSSGIKRRHQ